MITMKGKTTQKIDRQPQRFKIIPARVGPIAGPKETTNDDNPIIVPRFSGGKIVTNVVICKETNNPPAAA